MTWLPPMTVALYVGGHTPGEMIKNAERNLRDFFGDTPQFTLQSIADLEVRVEFPTATLTFAVEYPDPIYGDSGER